MMAGAEALRVVAARKHWREADARVVVEAWRESGLTQLEFSRTHGVHAKRLARWAGRLRFAEAPTGYHEIRVRQPERSVVPTSIEIVLREQRTVRVTPGLAADDLRRVLDVYYRHIGAVQRQPGQLRAHIRRDRCRTAY